MAKWEEATVIDVPAPAQKTQGWQSAPVVDTPQKSNWQSAPVVQQDKKLPVDTRPPEFVRRMGQNNISPIKNEDNTISTHRMMSFEQDGKYLAAPTIVNQDGKLVQLSNKEAMDYALKNNEFAEFATEKDAQKYAEGSWKKGDMAGAKYPSKILQRPKPITIVETPEQPTQGWQSAPVIESPESLLRRFGKQLWNTGIATPAHELGKSDETAASARATELLFKWEKENNTKLNDALFKDQLQDWTHQLTLPPNVRDSDFLVNEPQFANKPNVNPFTQKVKPSTGLAESAVDTVAGLAGFVAQLAITKRYLPAGTPDAVIWEVQNLASGGPPGKGAAMQALYSIPGKALEGLKPGKLKTAAQLTSESALLGGVTAVEGGSPTDIALAAAIPSALRIAGSVAKIPALVEKIQKGESLSRSDLQKIGITEPTSQADRETIAQEVKTQIESPPFRAQARGEIIPPEVLAEYPDLAGQGKIKEGLNAPLKELGGMPRKPPELIPFEPLPSPAPPAEKQAINKDIVQAVKDVFTNNNVKPPKITKVKDGIYVYLHSDSADPRMSGGGKLFVGKAEFAEDPQGTMDYLKNTHDSLIWVEENRLPDKYKINPTPSAAPTEGGKIAVKTSYTSVPEEWKQSKKLYDWGQKGLRAEGNEAYPATIGSKKTRKSFIWQGEFDKVPVRLPRETMNALRAKTDEIWKVQTQKGEDYYIVPKRVLADVKTELGTNAFIQGAKPIRSPKQKINDYMNAIDRQKGLTLADVGEGIEGKMAEYGLTEADLNDKVKKVFQEYQDAKRTGQIQQNVREGVAQKVSDSEAEAERRAIQDEQTAGEIGDFLDGIIEKERQVDLLGRPLTRGGASGTQSEFLNKEDFKQPIPDLAGQMKIKEGLNAPLKELGGMPRKPPGLTKDEMEHLGRREQEALKGGQALGNKIGYKLGERAAYDRANSVIFKLKTLKTVEAEHRAEAKELVDSFVPKEHRYRYTNRILNTKSPQMIKALMGQVEKYVAKADKRLAVRELRTFISGVRSEYGRGETPFGKLPENLRGKFKGFLDRYDLSKLSEDKAETLASRDEYVQGVAKNVAEELERLEFDSAADQDVANVMLMGNSRIQELRRLSKVHVAEMTTDEIRGIQQNFERMLREVELKNTIKERVKIEKMRDNTRKAVKQVMPSSTAGKIVEFTPGLRWLVKNGAANLKSLADFASGKDKDALVDIVWNKPIEGNKQRAEVNKKLSEAFKAKMESIGYTDKDFQENNDLVDIVYGGKKMKVPLAIPVTIYAHTIAEGNLERLLKSAGDTIRFPNLNKATGLFIGTTEYRTSKAATMEELKKIVDSVPDKHKKAVEAAMEFNWENVAPEANKYFEENKGYKVATKKRYWSSPTERDAPIGGEIPKLSSPPEQKGRYQPRTGGHVRRAIVPWFIEVASNIQDTAALSMAEPLRAFRATLANKEFRETMKSNGHGRILDEYDTLLKRIQGYSTDQSIIERNMSKFLGNYGKSRLAIRPSGFVVQTTSLSASFSVIDPKYFVNADVVTPDLIAKLKAKSGLAWERWEKGHFNFILGELSARHWFESTVYNKTPWTDKMTAPYTWGDEVALGKLYLATERQIEARTGHKIGTPENEKAAIEYWEKEVLPTQGMYDMLFRSDLTSHPNPVLRGSMLFMTTMNAFHNTIMQSMSDYSKGRISGATAGKNIGGVVTSTAMSTIVRKAVKAGMFGLALFLLGGRKEDKTETLKNKLLEDAKNTPKDIIFDLVGMAPFGNALDSAVQVAIDRIKRGYIPMDYSRVRTGNIFADVGLDTTQVFVDYRLAVSEYLDRNKKEGIYQSGPRAGQQKWKSSLIRAVDNSLDVVTGAAGLPYSGPKGDFYYPAKNATKGQNPASTFVGRETKEPEYQQRESRPIETIKR